ncbi:MAG: hypothetical protein KDI98_03230 [Hyphomicrobiaceae bacterium]|nr:hypothetical protein [Hyphomicrobiaceae bacterium]
MQRKAKTQGSQRRAWFNPRSLHMVIFVSVAIGVIVTEAVLLLPFSMVWQTQNIEQAADEVRAAFVHATDPATFPSVDDVTRTADRFMRDGLIIGASVLDASGEQLSTVGDRPFLTLDMVRRGGLQTWESADGAALDLYIDPSETGMANPLVARLAMAPIDAATHDRIVKTALAILAIVLGSSMVSVIALNYWIVKPMRKLQGAIMAAVDNPDVADQFKTGLKRRDELGSISRSLDLLFTAVSLLHQEELATLHKQNEESLIGVLQYSGDGKLQAANPAALDMLGFETETELRKADQHMVIPKNGSTSRKTFLDIEVDTDSLVPVELLGRVRQIAAHVQHIPVRRRDGTVARHFITLIELDRMSRELQSLQERVKKADAKLSKVSAREQETRRVLESCLCLLDTGSEKPRVEPAVMPDRIVNEWYKDAAEANLVSGKLEHGVLPQLEGDPARIREVFRQALLVVYAKTTIERPTMGMEADMPDEKTARFIIRDISKDRIGGGRQVEKSVDWRLPLAALQVALGKCGGQIVDMVPEGAPPRLALTLKASKVQPFDINEEDLAMAG